MDKKKQLRELVKMNNAIKNNGESFILLEKMNEIIDKIEAIQPTDVSYLTTDVNNLSAQIENIEKVNEQIKKYLDEPLEITLEIT